MLTFEPTFQQLQPKLSFLSEITRKSVHLHLQNITSSSKSESYKNLNFALNYFDILLSDELIDIDSHSYLGVYARRNYYKATL